MMIDETASEVTVMRFTTGLLATVISLCPLAYASANGAAAALSAGELEMVRTAKDFLEKDLADPDSVLYRKVVIVDEGKGAYTVCGEFNARNRMGGYVGYRTFAVVDGDSAYIAPSTVTEKELRQGLKRPLSGDGQDPVFIWSFCKEQG